MKVAIHRLVTGIIAGIAIISLFTNIIFSDKLNESESDRNTALLQSDSLLALKLLGEKKLYKASETYEACVDQRLFIDNLLMDQLNKIELQEQKIKSLKAASAGTPLLKKEVAELKHLQSQYELLLTNINKEKKVLEEKLRTAQEERKKIAANYSELVKKLDQAKELKGQILSFTNRRHRIEDKNTQKSIAVNTLSIVYGIEENPLADAGKRNVYLVVRDENGRIVGSAGKKFMNTKTRQEIAWSTARLIDYKNNQQEISLDLDYEGKLLKGNYTFEVYIDGVYSGGDELALQ